MVPTFRRGSVVFLQLSEPLPHLPGRFPRLRGLGPARLPQAALECRALVEFGEVPLTDTARRLLAAAGWHTRPDTRPAVVAVLRDVWPEAIPAGWRTR